MVGHLLLERWFLTLNEVDTIFLEGASSLWLFRVTSKAPLCIGFLGGCLRSRMAGHTAPSELLFPASLFSGLPLLLDFLDVLNLGTSTDLNLGAGLIFVRGLEVSGLLGGLLLLLDPFLLLLSFLLLLMLQLLRLLLLALLFVEERGDVFLFLSHCWWMNVLRELKA
jgi:hypothetical protein